MVLIHHQYSRCRRSWFGPINKSAASRIRAANKSRPYFCAEAQRVVSPWSFVARPYPHSKCKRVEFLPALSENDLSERPTTSDQRLLVAVRIFGHSAPIPVSEADHVQHSV